MHACSDVAPLKLLLLLLLLWLLLLLLLFDGANVPDDGDLVCAAFELCSDLMDSGVCDFIECASVLWPNRFADGGVCAPPVIIDDELESSSFSLSNVLCTGDFSPRLPWTYWRNKRGRRICFRRKATATHFHLPLKGGKSNETEFRNGGLNFILPSCAFSTMMDACKTYHNHWRDNCMVCPTYEHANASCDLMNWQIVGHILRARIWMVFRLEKTKKKKNH